MASATDIYLQYYLQMITEKESCCSTAVSDSTASNSEFPSGIITDNTSITEKPAIILFLRKFNTLQIDTPTKNLTIPKKIEDIHQWLL